MHNEPFDSTFGVLDHNNFVKQGKFDGNYLVLGESSKAGREFSFSEQHWYNEDWTSAGAHYTKRTEHTFSTISEDGLFVPFCLQATLDLAGNHEFVANSKEQDEARRYVS